LEKLMARSRVFKVMVPSGHGPGLVVTGKIGPTPDTSLIDNVGHCARSRLPGFIDDLVFTFPRPGPSFPEKRQNFYLLRDFFVVSREMMQFLLGHLSDQEVEVRKVCVRHDDGTPAADAYFALKIVSAIDCIDPHLSTCVEGVADVRPFGERTTVYELNQSLTAEFASKGGTHYVSYPRWGVQSVHLKENAIPTNVMLFQPAYWPAFSIIDAEFARLLADRCWGGYTGYYFWTLDLDSMSRSYGELMQALR
jgi:hypothetical protein